VRKRPKSIYAELYSDPRESAEARLEHIELGIGARTNVIAITDIQCLEFRRTGEFEVLTDEKGIPILP
jgi:hypothetical protein